MPGKTPPIRRAEAALWLRRRTLRVTSPCASGKGRIFFKTDFFRDDYIQLPSPFQGEVSRFTGRRG